MKVPLKHTGLLIVNDFVKFSMFRFMQWMTVMLNQQVVNHH